MAEFDILIYGATGFTGSQLAKELHDQAPKGTRLALGGRNAEKLAKVAEPLGLPVVVADAMDKAAVDAMVKRASVVVTTAGPYAMYGDHVVDSCVAHGVHYLDITGETPWVRQVIDRHHESAKAQGTVVLPCCGFDSVPSDLGVLFMVKRVRERLDQGTKSVEAAFSIKGSFNGGTLASGLNIGEKFKAKDLANPFLLNPDPKTSREAWSANADPKGPVTHAQLGSLAPFFMGPVNTRVVRRSAALLADSPQSYGPEFSYQEYMRMGGTVSAWGATLAMGAMAAGMAKPAGRSLMARFGPKPGEGPSEADMDGGFVKVRYAATAMDGQVLQGQLKAPGDPGNRVTVRILAQAALCVLEGEDLPGGVLTPAVALGQRLQDRLVATGKWEMKLLD